MWNLLEKILPILSLMLQQQNVVMNISQAQTSDSIIQNFTFMNGTTPGEATGLEGGGIPIKRC